MKSNFAKVPEKPNFPQEEEKILKYWQEIDAFKKQLELTKDMPPFTFYDGPPFATGLPHYGHILAGTIKDVVTRYATMKGHYVERRFGWDCHGLPVEYEIDKKYKITSFKQREEMGVAEYNRRCREIVMTYSKDWERIVGRFARWIDFDNCYKTMDVTFMESVWWTFKQIYEKGLVYRGQKVMPFSTGCNTVLSNFEAGSNYKNVQDPAIIVTFPLEEEPDTAFLAWTTTPWTLPSNLALNVHPELEYVKFLDQEKNRKFICGKDLLGEVLKQIHVKKHQVLETFKGTALGGKRYQPLFQYFAQYRETGCFQVICSDYVTNSEGTSIVHSAPGFGEDDYNACIKAGIVAPGKVPCPIDMDGKFLPVIAEFAGMYIKDADHLIKEHLKAQGRLVSAGAVFHNYPFCWRSETPLIYRTFDTWFIRVTDESLKPKLVENNYQSKWIPPPIQNGRFDNWLKDARDWCFSRNRFWGNPIPIWTSEDMEEVVCVGSIQELKELSGVQEITDLHRESIDHITIPSKQGKGLLRRIPEVFDCWFESGSMPFAQSHYPFSMSEEQFQKGYPADFIAEGLDQTRGWFYTLHVIANAVKGQACFKNCVVNGIVLAADGQKMSKSKRNFPDPMLIADNFGVDACRLYLCSSPAVRAEPMRFQEDGVKEVVKKVFLPWFNAYRFLIQNISRLEGATGEPFFYDPELKEVLEGNEQANIMDRWIIATNQHLIKYVRNEMDNYRLYNVVKHMLEFLEQLTNWYVRLNRSRMKGEEGLVEQRQSLNTLFDVLLSTTTMMACITPYFADYFYLNLRNGIRPTDQHLHAQSVHFLRIPNYKEHLLNEDIEAMVQKMGEVILLGRKIRDAKKLPVKTPLYKAVIVEANPDNIRRLKLVEKYIKEELNVLEVQFEANEDQFVLYKSEPMNEPCGKAFKKDYGALKPKLQNLDRAQIMEYINNNKVVVDGKEIVEGMLQISRTFNPTYSNHPEYSVESDLQNSIMLYTVLDDTLKKMGASRELVTTIQQLRKSAGVSIDDTVEVFFQLEAADPSNCWLGQVLQTHSAEIQKSLKMPVFPEEAMQKHMVRVSTAEFESQDAPGEKMKITMCSPAVFFAEDKLQAKFQALNSDKVNFVEDLKNFVAAHDLTHLRQKVQAAGGKLVFRLNGSEVTLQAGEDFFFSVRDRQ